MVQNKFNIQNKIEIEKKIRILIITPYLKDAGKIISLLTLYLNNKYDITIVTPFLPLSSQYKNILPFKGELKLIDLKWIPPENFLKKIAFFFVRIRLLYKLSNENKPDIVFINLSHSLLIPVLFLKMFKLIKSKVIIRIATPVFKTVKEVYRKFLISNIYKYADKIIVNSNGLKKEILNFKICEKKISVLYNPVDIREIEEKAKEKCGENLFDGSIPVIISVGRIVPEKNYELLIKAFEIVRKKIEAKLLIIGEGELKLELSALTKALGIEKDVYFLGWRENPFKYMKKADVFVLSSDFEGFGFVIVEAMACSCPVISTDCPYGPAEILENGKYGILVPPDNENKMAEEIIRLLKNKNLREDLSKKGKERAKDFDIKKIVKEYEEIFENMLF